MTSDPSSPAGRHSSLPTVVVVGLGPAGVDLLTMATVEAIEAHPVRFVRTVRHPSASVVAGAESFDHVYDSADTMDEVYRTIAARLIEQAGVHGTVLYAVPGSPVVAERTVELLVADPSVSVELVPALSFVDLAWVRLGIDPVAVGARIVDGHRFDVEAAGTSGALLVAQCDRTEVLESVKLAVGDMLESAGTGGSPGTTEPPVVTVLQQLGGADEQVVTVPWFELDRIVPDHLTSVWLPPLGSVLSGEVARLATLVTTLRERCPWDRDQTHGSLRPHLLEEAHEVLEALDVLAAHETATADDADGHSGDPNGRPDDADDPYGHLVEELGDLLFQVVFHASLAAEQGQFTLADVATGIHDKLVARHPHVFGDLAGDAPDPSAPDPSAPDPSAPDPSARDLAGNWENAKRVEKGRDSVFDGIPVGLPALARAAKVLRKASVVTDVAGDDLPPRGVPSLALPDPAVAAAAGDMDGEVGAMLLAVVAMARRNGVDPESALRRVSAQFEATVREIEADPSQW
jgi:tetrapyrrole methylase family protein / MazG family protein